MALRFHRAGFPASSSLEEVVSYAPVELDTDTLASRLFYGSTLRAGATLYRGVTCTEDAAVEHPPVAPLTPSPNPVAAAHALRRSLAAAVDRALLGVRSVAVLAGGGTDSAALLALSVAWARRTGGRAFAVSLDFEGPGDDRPYLAALEDALGCEIFRLAPEAGAEHFDRVTRGEDAAPLTWPAAPMEIALFRTAKAHGAEVVLSGVGADELLDGEPSSCADLLHSAQVGDALATVAALRGFERPRSAVVRWLVRPLLGRMLPIGLRRVMARMRRRTTPAWWGAALRAHHARWTSMQLERSLARPRDPEGRRRAFAAAPHREHLRWLAHQEVRAGGLPRVDPYVDPEVVATITRLPPTWLLHGGVRRGLFREAMRGVLPDLVRLRMTKASFEPAFRRCLAAAVPRGDFDGAVQARHLEALDLVDADLFEPQARRFLAGHDDADGWATIWPVLTAESFLRSRAA